MITNSCRYEKLDQQEVLRILFHPRQGDGTKPPDEAIDFDIPVAESVRIGARLYPAGVEAPTILFFHGNGEIVDDYDTVGSRYNEQDLNFLAVDYRGYGRSNGEPSVTSMMQDAHVIFKEVRKWLQVRERTGPLVIMGRSLGSAAALEVAAAWQSEIVALIIESAFSTTLPFLQRLGLDTRALGITEADGFQNVRKIMVCTRPTLILHARFDEIIPVSEAEILQAQSGARSKEFLVVPGADHNTIMAQAGKLYFEVIKRFINKIIGNPRSGKRYRR